MILWGAGKRMEKCVFRILSMPLVGNQRVTAVLVPASSRCCPARAAAASGAVGQYVQ